MAQFIPLIAAAVTTAGTVYAAGQARKASKQTQAPAAEVPDVGAPEPMPVADDAQAALAKRRSVADQMRRRGRASTILTDLQGGEGLGG